LPVHYLPDEAKPGNVACGAPGSPAAITDPEQVTCGSCRRTDALSNALNIKINKRVQENFYKPGGEAERLGLSAWQIRERAERDLRASLNRAVAERDQLRERLPADRAATITYLATITHLAGALRDICSEYAYGSAAHAVAYQALTDDSAVEDAEQQIAAVTGERDRFAQQFAELRSVLLQGARDAGTIRRRAIAILACQDTGGTSERAQAGAAQ
jgi:hypothetical protein